MNQVEELCDRILLIDHGRSVLYGSLREIQDRYAPHAVRFRGTQLPASVSGAASMESQGDNVVAYLIDGITPSVLVRQLIDAGAELTHFEVVTPPLEDIFISVVEKRDTGREERSADGVPARDGIRTPSEGRR
jgi:ABC-2 type transport system ATP-binding protein